MNCPKCNDEFNESQQGPYTCYLCNECEGIWIPGKEIDNILRGETGIESFEGILVFIAGDKEPLKNGGCPNCSDEKLNVKSVKGIELDICEKCNGIFFDKNELNNIFSRGLGNSTVPDEIAYGSVEAVIQMFVALLKGLG